MTFKERYTLFLNQLEKIAQEHDELTDTDVRERLHEVINYYFIWDNAVDSEFPSLYAMFSPEGNKAVFEAIRSFVIEASVLAENEGIKAGEERHKAIEDLEITTNAGESFDLFLGSSDIVLPANKPASDSIYQDDEEDESYLN